MRNGYKLIWSDRAAKDLNDHNFREVHKCINRIMFLNECYLKEVKDPKELIPYGYYEE